MMKIDVFYSASKLEIKFLQQYRVVRDIECCPH